MPEQAPNDTGATPAQPAPVEHDTGHDVNWETLAGDTPGVDDGADEAASLTPTEPATPAAAPVEPAPVPASSAPAAPASGAQPVVAAPPPPSPVEPSPQPPAAATPATAAPVVQAPPVATPAEVQAAAEQFRQGLAAKLAEGYTASMSEDQKRELLTSPETVLPGLLARAVVDAMQLGQMAALAQVPQIVEQATRKGSVRDRAREAFHKAHPDLAKPEYEGVLTAAASAYRQANPRATQEEAIAAVGPMARVMLKLPEPTAQAAPAAASASTAPATPFVPVRRSGAAAPPTTAAAKGGYMPELLDDD